MARLEICNRLFKLVNTIGKDIPKGRSAISPHWDAPANFFKQEVKKERRRLKGRLYSIQSKHNRMVFRFLKFNPTMLI